MHGLPVSCPFNFPNGNLKQQWSHLEVSICYQNIDAKKKKKEINLHIYRIHLLNPYKTVVSHLNQLITEPTRVTVNPCSLIDHCITNSPDKIAKSGAVHLAIRDYAQIYMTHKTKYEPSGSRIIRTRHTKNFQKSGYLKDPQEKAWSDIETRNDPNDMWSMWKDMLIQSIDKYDPLIPKRDGNKKALRINDHLRREMHKRDFLKKESHVGP